MVDFGYPTSIGGGKLWGPVECCWERLDGFQIWAGNNGFAYNGSGNVDCYTAVTTEHHQSPYTHDFTCTALGRYLFVVSPTGQCLSMREVEIYLLGENSFKY
jgi:hypothetical protein